MRYLSAIFSLFLAANVALAGLPPTTLSGQAAATTPTTFKFKAPKNQSTVVSGIESLIETGNANELKNPGFEGGTTSWTASGGTFTATTTAGEFISGSKSGSWDSSSASQTLTSDAITIPQGLKGVAAVVSCRVLTPSGTSTHTIAAYDGSSNLASASVTSSTTVTRATVNFTAPSSGTVAIRFTSVNANEPELEIDDCYLGVSEGFIPDHVGTVTIGASAAVRIESANVSGATVTEGSGSDWINGSAAQSGSSNSIRTITFNAGKFTTAPHCLVTVTPGFEGGIQTAPSTTSVAVQTRDSNGNAADGAFYIMCMGLR